jgi:thiamine-monophosphate kinase
VTDSRERPQKESSSESARGQTGSRRTAGHLPLIGGGEFALIRDLLSGWGDAARGVGSDCATIDVPSGERLVVSTDTSVEGVDFRREWLTGHEIGYRAAAGAWSDIAAAAAKPLGMLVALAVPTDLVTLVPEIGEGIGEVARLVGAPIVGGDLSTGGELVLTITVLGSAARPLTRGGARIGDRVYVTGTLGGPRKALDAWLSGDAPDESARARFARPVPRLREAQWLAARGVLSAIDVSDGVVGDLAQMAAASEVHLIIDLDRLPAWSGASPTDAAASGEEYELAFSSPVPIDVAAFSREFALPLTQIGEAVAGAPGIDVLLAGRRVDPVPGYDHFSR